MAGKPYNAGSSTRNGVSNDLDLISLTDGMSTKVSPRSDTAALDTYGDIMQSYCDTGDEFCDSAGEGQNNLNIHLQEIKNHGPAAASFIISKFGGNATAVSSAANPGITCQTDVLPPGTAPLI